MRSMLHAVEKVERTRLSSADWEQGALIDQVQPIADPRERLRELFRLIGRGAKSHVIYSALLRALDHPNVQPVMARLSQARMDFLTHAYRQMGMSADVAAYRARLAYAAYVGFLQLTLQVGMPRLEHDEMEAYVEHVIETLIPA
jgi:hypothetical protein